MVQKPGKTISEIHDEYYGERKDKVSRHDLMLKAKERGIKNYRILNKQELADVLVNIENTPFIH